MPDSLDVTFDLLVLLAAMALLALGGYVGFRLGRIQGTRIYRRRALWMGIVSLFLNLYLFSFALHDIQSLYFCTYSPSGVCRFTLFPLPFWYYFANLGTDYLGPWAAGTFLGLVFTNIRVAVNQDYLHRDTLQWHKVQWVAMGLIAVVVLLQSFFFLTGGYLIGFDFIQRVVVSSNGDIQVSTVSTTSPLIALYSAISIGTAVYFALVLLLSSVRSPDPQVRRLSLWVGLSVIAVFVSVVLGVFVPMWLGRVPVAFAAYFYLQAARSLSPTGRIEKDVTEEILPRVKSGEVGSAPP